MTITPVDTSTQWADIRFVATGNACFLSTFQGDGDGKLVFFETTEGKTAITDVKEFTEYSVTVGSYPDEADKLKFFLVYLANTTGTVYFDDIPLTAK